jgi:hypothetical protein
MRLPARAALHFRIDQFGLYQRIGFAFLGFRMVRHEVLLPALRDAAPAV